jgi:hypothetical protein
VPKVLYEHDNIGYSEDHWHSLFRTIPADIDDFAKVVNQHLCSFLNGSGGILCFGCRENGRIYGETISRKEEDTLRLMIDARIKKMHPFVSPSTYRVTFTPVHSHYNKTSVRYVLEIRVTPGDRYQLYETEFHESYLRTNRLRRIYGPLTPHEIKRHVIQQYKKKIDDEAKLSNDLKAATKSKKQVAHVNPLPQATKSTLTIVKSTAESAPSTASESAPSTASESAPSTAKSTTKPTPSTTKSTSESTTPKTKSTPSNTKKSVTPSTSKYTTKSTASTTKSTPSKNIRYNLRGKGTAISPIVLEDTPNSKEPPASKGQKSRSSKFRILRPLTNFLNKAGLSRRQ